MFCELTLRAWFTERRDVITYRAIIVEWSAAPGTAMFVIIAESRVKIGIGILCPIGKISS